jgi:hypothetical protein
MVDDSSGEIDVLLRNVDRWVIRIERHDTAIIDTRVSRVGRSVLKGVLFCKSPRSKDATVVVL